MRLGDPPQGVTEPELRFRPIARSRDWTGMIPTWDALQVVTESEYLISSHGFRHVTPNLGYLTKTAKCKVIFFLTWNEQR